MHQHSQDAIDARQYAIDARKKIAMTAQAMIEGKISFIEGARKIYGLGHTAGLEQSDPDFLAFTAIDSQTDALPMGKVRELWSPDALSKLQPEIDSAERWARDAAMTHCRNLVARFG